MSVLDQRATGRAAGSEQWSEHIADSPLVRHFSMSGVTCVPIAWKAANRAQCRGCTKTEQGEERRGEESVTLLKVVDSRGVHFSNKFPTFRSLRGRVGTVSLVSYRCVGNHTDSRRAELRGSCELSFSFLFFLLEEEFCDVQRGCFNQRGEHR